MDVLSRGLSENESLDPLDSSKGTRFFAFCFLYFFLGWGIDILCGYFLCEDLRREITTT
jgi:hypothetical protein